VREIDDVEEAEDHREAEREHRVERAVDEADQELAEQRLRRHAEDLSHVRMAMTRCVLERAWRCSNTFDLLSRQRSFDRSVHLPAKRKTAT
jgi:hypothetical protein